MQQIRDSNIPTASELRQRYEGADAAMAARMEQQRQQQVVVAFQAEVDRVVAALTDPRIALRERKCVRACKQRLGERAGEFIDKFTQKGYRVTSEGNFLFIWYD